MIPYQANTLYTSVIINTIYTNFHDEFFFENLISGNSDTLTNHEQQSTSNHQTQPFLSKNSSNQNHKIYTEHLPNSSSTGLKTLSKQNEIFLLSRILIIYPLKLLLLNKNIVKSTAMISVQTYALETLIQVISFHDHDARLNKNILIARLYVDLLPLIINVIQYKNDLNHENLLTLLIAFIWVLKNLDSSLIKKYFTSLNIFDYEKLINLCHLCLDLFEFKEQNLTNPLYHQTGLVNTAEQKSTTLSKMAEAILGEGSAASKLRNRSKFSEIGLANDSDKHWSEIPESNESAGKTYTKPPLTPKTHLQRNTITSTTLAGSDLKHLKRNWTKHKLDRNQSYDKHDLFNKYNTVTDKILDRSDTFVRNDFELKNQTEVDSIQIRQQDSARLLHPTVTAEVSRVILKSVVNNILFEKDVLKHLCFSNFASQNHKLDKLNLNDEKVSEGLNNFYNSILNILIKILKLQQSNEIYHKVLKLIREYPDSDLNIKAFEALINLTLNSKISETVKTDAVKTILLCLENGSEKVSVNILITISEMIGKPTSGKNMSHKLRIVLKTMFEYIDYDKKYAEFKKLDDSLGQHKMARRSTIFRSKSFREQKQHSVRVERQIEIIQLIKELDDMIIAHLKLRSSRDSDLKIALLHKIAKSCNRLPVLRIKWLIRCSDRHKE